MLNLLDICILASLLPKTNIQVRCWIRCFNILAWFSMPCSLPCFTHAFVYLRNPRLFLMVKLRVFSTKSDRMWFPQGVYLLRKVWRWSRCS